MQACIAVGCYALTVLPAAVYGYRLALRRQRTAVAPPAKDGVPARV